MTITIDFIESTAMKNTKYFLSVNGITGIEDIDKVRQLANALENTTTQKEGDGKTKKPE
jgi:hypothetical protein